MGESPSEEKAWFELQLIIPEAESMQASKLPQHATVCAFCVKFQGFESNLWAVSTYRNTRDKDIEKSLMKG